METHGGGDGNRALGLRLLAASEHGEEGNEGTLARKKGDLLQTKECMKASERV